MYCVDNFINGALLLADHHVNLAFYTGEKWSLFILGECPLAYMHDMPIPVYIYTCMYICMYTHIPKSKDFFFVFDRIFLVIKSYTRHLIGKFVMCATHILSNALSLQMGQLMGWLIAKKHCYNTNFRTFCAKFIFKYTHYIKWQSNIRLFVTTLFLDTKYAILYFIWSFNFDYLGLFRFTAFIYTTLQFVFMMW